MKNLKEFLNEGSWGYSPLDNDSAADWKWHLGNILLNELKPKLEPILLENKHDYNTLSKGYHAIGMWIDLRDKLKTNYSYFTDSTIIEMNKICLDVAIIISTNSVYINSWKDPKKITLKLEEVIMDLS